MKYTVSQYAAALVESVEGKSDTERTRVLKNFTALLGAHRALSQLPRVLEAAEHYLLKKQGLKKVVVESAAPLESGAREEIKKMVRGSAHFEELIKPELIAGVKILIDDKILIDASGKRQIERMLKSRSIA